VTQIRNSKLPGQKEIASLIAQTPLESFGATALALLSSVAQVENFGAYHISDLQRPAPVLSFWSGRISDYWFQRDADLILSTPQVRAGILDQVTHAPETGVHIEHWSPDADDPRAAIYARNGIIERLAVSSRDGRAGVRSFYLRSAKDGLLSKEEIAGLCEILPIVHGLIGLRHKIVGTARHTVRSIGQVSRLRDMNVPAFCALSPREAKVCDLVTVGKSVAATALDLSVSEATVRTLRARAYRKLNVTSATELMALFIRSQVPG